MELLEFSDSGRSKISPIVYIKGTVRDKASNFIMICNIQS
jgi:hypothetical protein